MTIGEYEIIRKLGSGGMSEVYEAVNKRLGSRHAVKVYTYPKQDAEVRERFLTEGRLLARLSHPSVVHVSDFGTDTETGRPYFVMNLVLNKEGQPCSLADIEPGSVDEETIARWYEELREALAYIHAEGIVHRDLKLQNILVGPDNHVVLADFGISRLFAPSDKGKTVVDVVQTLVRVKEGHAPVMGSIGYLAPELEMGAAATAQSDWYALGVIVYRLLTGLWCDARTDILEGLETYDPVWRRIVPKLLHANPEGRECLSFKDEKRADLEKREVQQEERLLRVKKNRRVLQYGVWGLSALVLMGGGLGLTREFGWRRRAAESRTQQEALSARLALPTFESLFEMPNAGRGSVSREEVRSALIDALVATRRLFADLHQGAITPEKFEAELSRMLEVVRNNETDSLFVEYPDYMQNGDDEVLATLFRNALKNLK